MAEGQSTSRQRAYGAGIHAPSASDRLAGVDGCARAAAGSIGSRIRALIWLMLVVCAAESTAGAQTRAAAADLNGSVRDQSNALMVGVTITATNADAGIVRTSTTDDGGRFSLLALPVGIYTVRAESSGFGVEVLQDVALTVGSAVDLSIMLGVSALTEQVTVVAAQPAAIDTQKTAITTVVSQQQIDNLPINGRNFISFAMITPGVNVDRSGNQGAAATSGLVFAGQRPRSNNITVDGLDNNDATVGSVRATFSQEAIREFQVLTNSYSAEFGNAAGGVLNIVTRSGTNTFHGNGFLFWRDKALNGSGYFENFTPAGDPISLPKTPFKQKQFGATVGGPLRRDRSFFFLSFERLDVAAAHLITIDDTTLVPDPAGGPPLGTPAGILRTAGFPIETGHVPFAIEKTQFLGKVDHRFSDAQQLAVRVNVASTLDENIEPWGGLVARSRGAALDATDYAVAATHALIGSRTINEGRMQYAVRDQLVSPLDPRCPQPCTDELQGGPTISVPAIALAGRQIFTPGPREGRLFQMVDTLSHVRGRHQLKTGFDVSVTDTTARLPFAFGGQFAFAALPAIPGVTPAPISAIQAVALGVPVAYVQGYGNSDASYPLSDMSLFGQDDWAIRTNLTLKLGVRYQLQFWPERLPRDRNDVAPRLGLAWDPAGDKRTVVRAAYGIFYDSNVTTIVANTKALNGTTGVRSFVFAFPSAIPGQAWSTPGHRLTEPPPGDAPSLIVAVDPAMKTPHTHHLSAGVDREAFAGVVFAGSVVYARGFNFLGIIDYNPILADLGPNRRPADIDGRSGTSQSVGQYTSYAETWYRGLIVSASKRQGPNQILASYTLSKAEDNATDYIGGLQDNGRGRNPADPTGLPIDFDRYAERSRSIHDQRHRLVLSGAAMLPGAVQATSIVTIGSGRPYNILAGVDFDRDGTVMDRPRRNPAAAPRDYSTAIGRNAGTTPGEAVVDVRFQRRVPLTSRAYLDAIVEVFNLFNRTNFTQVNTTWGPGAYPDRPLPTFGQFTAAGSPRQLQLAVKVGF